MTGCLQKVAARYHAANLFTANYDKVVSGMYNQFKNAATQIIMAENFLPVQASKQEGGK